MSGLGQITRDGYDGLVVAGYPPGLAAMSTWRAGAAFRARMAGRGGRAGSADRQASVVTPTDLAADPVPATAVAADAGGSGHPSHLLSADELPDGLIVADHDGVVVIFNRAAERLTGIKAAQALGKTLPAALPLADSEGRCWWRASRPYDGLSIRTRHPERSLFLGDGTELLVTIGYVRKSRTGEPDERGAVQRLTITLRSASVRARLERTRAELVSTVAHELRSPLTSCPTA